MPLARLPQSITSRIELVDDSGEDITVRYRSRCLGDELQLRNHCTDIKTGDLVSFSIELEANTCPQQKVRVEEKSTFWDSFAFLRQVILV